MKRLLAFVIAFAAVLPAAAQNDTGSPTTSPGPQTVPLPNINTGANPTFGAHLPSSVSGNPMQPTFPAGGSGSAWTEGTIPSDKTAPGKQDEEARRKEAERERSVAEPMVNGAPSAPESQVVSPSGPGEQPNPEAPQNNPPQPGTAP